VFDVISAFWDGTMCCSLVHKLGHKQPKTAKKLLDIGTQHASGVQAIGAAFTLAEVVVAASGGPTTPPNITIRGTKKGAKGGKKGQKCHPRRVTVMANNGNIRKEIENSDEEFMAVVERDFRWRTRKPKDHLEKILEASYPHHLYPVKHKLKDCMMMKRFMSSTGTPPGIDESARDPRGGGMVLREVKVTLIAS
jgi:hypothetical protein